MQKTIRMMVAAGAMGLGMIATAGPEHKEHAEKAECPPDCVKACCVDLAELVGYKAPSLIVGSEAPEMKIAQFVKGESMDGFEEGKVYVVEFWATWCGPCVAAFPHISELQKEFGDKLQVVGVNIWDRKQDRKTGAFDESEGEWVERITEFVDDQGDRMSYTVALQQGTAMQDNWMAAAGQDGIPSAFIVNGEGQIAWIGHPGSIDSTLEEVIDGSFDFETAAKEAQAEQEENRSENLLRQAFQYSMSKIMSEDESVSAEGYHAARALAKQLINDDARMLNALAWPILDPETEITNLDFEFALELGHRAAELTEFEEPMILDTYAMALFKSGDVKGAVKFQKKAIKMLDSDEYLAEFEAHLADFEGEG